MVLWMGRPSKPMSSNFSRRACLPVTLSSWTTCRAIRSRVYAKLSPRRGPTSAISRLTAQISILSSSSLPSSRRCSGRPPRELSMTCSRQSPMLSPSSPHRNAPTMSQTAAIATQPENALGFLCFFARLPLSILAALNTLFFPPLQFERFFFCFQFGEHLTGIEAMLAGVASEATIVFAELLEISLGQFLEIEERIMGLGSGPD